MNNSSVHNKRIKNNANGMADVTKSNRFHALEEKGAWTDPLSLRQNFLTNKWRIALGEWWSHFRLHDSVNGENSSPEKDLHNYLSLSVASELL